MSTQYSAGRIYLVGMMGVGKTTLGKKLANQLHYSFMDLDKEIELAEGKSISQLFEENGEGYFRQKEREHLLNTQQRNHIVIATGGGAPAFFNNMEWMNASGKTVYLKAEIPFIVSRIAQHPGKRPLLKDKEGEEITEFLTRLWEGRRALYEQAQVIMEIPQIPGEGLQSLISSLK